VGDIVPYLVNRLFNTPINRYLYYNILL